MEIDKRIYNRFVVLLLGVAMFLFGFNSLVTSFFSPRHMSDQEIINKAKQLGLVEMKDVLKAEEQRDGKK